MILDSSEDDCQFVNFRLGTSSGTTRTWEIKVTQYKCDNVDVSGPPGCLQYYTSTSGIIQSFNFPAPSETTIGSTVTHLSNQNYEVCIRRAIEACYICYFATIDVAASTAASQHSFGLSAIPATGGGLVIVMAAAARRDQECTTDYIMVICAHNISTDL